MPAEIPNPDYKRGHWKSLLNVLIEADVGEQDVVLVEAAPGDVGRLVSQLARCQRSGSPAADTVRSLLESDISAERSRRIERARALPIRLMIPMALLVLPGVILLLYAPALIRLWQDMSIPLQ